MYGYGEIKREGPDGFDMLFEILSKSDDYLQITEIINQLKLISSGRL